MMQNKPTQTLNNIQMLRAIAALLVVFHHALPHYAVMGGEITLISSIGEWGFLGVDIFFVISGFIMAYTTFNKERTFLNAKIFMKHRLFRIYLGYWPFFFMMLVIGLYKDANFDIIGSFFLTNTEMSKLVLPISWSLTFELYFYFLFLLTFLFSINKLYLLIPLFACIALFIALYPHLYIALAAYFIPSLPMIEFSPLLLEFAPLLLEFLSGVLLYMYKDHLMKRWILFLCVLIVIIVYSLGMIYEFKYGITRVLSFGAGAFFIVLGALILEEKNLYRAGSMFVLLGNASYTLYLSHLIIIEFFHFVGLRTLFSTNNEMFLPLIGLLIMISLAVIFSLVYYQKIEKPIYQKAIAYGRLS